MVKNIKSNLELCDALKNICDGDSFVFSEGRYFFNDTLRLNKVKNVSFKAENGANVYFDGGVIIDPKSINKTTDGKVLSKVIEEYAKELIYEIDLSKYNIKKGEYGNRGFRRPYIPAPNELFIDNEAYKVASYPKDSYIPMTRVIDSGSRPVKEEFDMHCPIIGYDFDRGDKWVNADDAYISGFFAECYADDTIKVDKINVTDRTIKTTMPSLSGVKTGNELRWKILNLIEELSEPGEYYYDKNTNKMYFIPQNDITNALVQVSSLDTPFLSFINCENITVEGIVFENSRGTGIYVEGGKNVTIDNCIFRNLGMLAVQIGRGVTPLPCGKHTAHGVYNHDEIKPEPMSEGVGSWHEYIYEYAAFDSNGGTNHSIENCEIYNTGTGGIMLGGGSRKKLVPGNNRVYNCHIHEVNRLDLTYKAAVNIWGVGNTISHCELENLDGFAVYLHGNDHILEYTKIHNVAKIISDGAAFYMGRDPSEVGNIIRYNFIYDIKNPHSYDMYGYTAIYFDDYSIYNSVYGNYFYDIVQKGKFFFSTVHWNCGGQTSVANNVFIDCYPGVDPNSYDNAYEKMHNDPLFINRVTAKDDDYKGVDVTSDIWREKYPYLYDTYMNNYNHTNVFYNNFVCSNQYHNFVDENPSHLNFKFRNNSYMLNKQATNVHDRVRSIEGETVKFENIDFESIGLIKKSR
ncbi:MAG: right-handed parallel beta-helix repeat-containing protein [Clostridia bacterium]|nr:right-handed parallel beta-helix repeat-containing protein [Clostridia bacterium]